MLRAVVCTLAWAASMIPGATPESGPDELLDRIRARMKENLARIPDYICLQTVERSRRPAPGSDWQPRDTLRLEVGFAGDKEVFAWRGASRFEEKELSDMIGAGVVGTGSFAIHANNVFLTGAPEFSYRGETELKGRRAIRYDYVVPQERSRYRIRVPPYQAVVGFRGSFWVDAETLDLMRLEVHSEDIPEELRLARASDVMEYARLAIGRGQFLLPESSELTMVGVHGDENRNRRELSGCRQYVGEASLSFSALPAGAAPGKPDSTRPELPPRLALELALESDIEPETAAAGDPIRAVLTRPLTDGGQVLAPEGTVVLGRLVRVEKYTSPITHYVVGLQFDTLELADARVEFSATMEQVSKAPGLIRQAKTLDPTFTRRRSPRLEILVRERQAGQGVLHWDAKHPRIRRGLKMRWRTEPVP